MDVEVLLAGGADFHVVLPVWLCSTCLQVKYSTNRSRLDPNMLRATEFHRCAGTQMPGDSGTSQDLRLHRLHGILPAMQGRLRAALASGRACVLHGRFHQTTLSVSTPLWAAFLYFTLLAPLWHHGHLSLLCTVPSRSGSALAQHVGGRLVQSQICSSRDSLLRRTVRRGRRRNA